jgi:hypothetical protein
MHDFELTVGVDWSEQHLDACAVDAAGNKVGEKRFSQDFEGVAQLAAWVLAFEPEPARVGVAIELKRGAIVAALIERGFVVAAINPKQLDRFRDRHGVSGAKDDRRDAWALADGLRTDPRAFRVVEPEHPLIVQLREAVRMHQDLTSLELMDANRLRDQLVRYFPAALQLGAGELSKPWFLDLLECIPNRARALEARESTIAAVLRRHRIRKLTASEALETLRRPALPLSAGASIAAERHVKLLVERLRLTSTQRKSNQDHFERLTAAFEEDLAQGQGREQHDVSILRSLPGVGRIVLAVLLAEGWEPLGQRDYRALRILAGVAPVTRRSGKRFVVSMRRACNPTLRQAALYMARAAVRSDPFWKARAAAIRARHARISQSHVHRIIADKLFKVMVAALRDGRPYAPELLRNAA